MLSALSFGSIYPHLKRLEQDGLIGMQEVSSEGRRKKVYELTAKGWRELANWLEQASEYPQMVRGITEVAEDEGFRATGNMMQAVALPRPASCFLLQ